MSRQPGAALDILQSLCLLSCHAHQSSTPPAHRICCARLTHRCRSVRLQQHVEQLKQQAQHGQQALGQAEAGAAATLHQLGQVQQQAAADAAARQQAEATIAQL